MTLLFYYQRFLFDNKFTSVLHFRNDFDKIDNELDKLLRSYGYEVAFQSDNDSLYLHKDAELKNRNYKN